jgi:hypothetical protein
VQGKRVSASAGPLFSLINSSVAELFIALPLLIKPDVQRLFSGSPTQDIAPDHDKGRRKLE